MASRYAKHLFFTFGLVLITAFIAGILLGSNMSSREGNQISSELKENELSAQSYLIEQELFKTFERDVCKLGDIRITDLSNQLYAIGSQLTIEDAESRLGVENYRALKRNYHLLQVKTYILFKKIVADCDIDHNVILYFYKRDAPVGVDQGPILDRIVKDYPSTVFAIEYNYSPDLNFIERFYEVNTTPAIIVNFDHQFRGLTSYEQLVEALEEEKTSLLQDLI